MHIPLYPCIDLHAKNIGNKTGSIYLFKATGYFIEVIHQYDAGLGSHTSATVILWEIKLIQF